MDPPKHTQTRRLMAKAPSPHMVDVLEPEIQLIADRPLDEMA